jgi:hypothetical protein
MAEANADNSAKCNDIRIADIVDESLSGGNILIKAELRF